MGVGVAVCGAAQNSVTLFAANINGIPTAMPFNPNSAYANASNSDMQPFPAPAVIAGLHDQGIKIQLAFLPNHNGTGWSYAGTTSTTATSLAAGMVDLMNQYDLDGISIDNKYADCPSSTDPQSDPQVMFNIATAIKANSGFNNKILSKSVYDDSEFFTGPSNMANVLDQAYTETYSQDDFALLGQYERAGMAPSDLWVGVSPIIKNSAANAKSQAAAVATAGVGGMMVFAPNGNLPNGGGPIFPTPQDAATYYTAIAQGEYGANASVTYSG